MPSLRKALKDVAMEKDAAVVARVTMSKYCPAPSLPPSFQSFSMLMRLHITAGGSFSPAPHAEETSEGSRRRTISGMGALLSYKDNEMQGISA